MAIPFYNHVEEEEEEGRSESEIVGNVEEKSGEIVSIESYSFLTELVKELVMVCCKYWKIGKSEKGFGSCRRKIERDSPSTAPHQPNLDTDHDDTIPILPMPQIEPDHLCPTGNSQFTHQIPPNGEDKSSRSSLNFKMSLTYTHKQIGRNLRVIGDRFRPQRQKQKYRRRRPLKFQQDTPAQFQTTLQFELDFKFAIPLALIGLGFCFLRRNDLNIDVNNTAVNLLSLLNCSGS